MKELDEAHKKLWEILKPYIQEEPWKPEVVIALTTRFFNIKGDRWKIAIINPQKSSTFNRKYKLVIWEGK